MASPEFWMLTFPVPSLSAGTAAMAERNGWDGLVFADTQHLSGNPYVALGLASAETTTLLLGTGVTNPVTREPAVTASAIATIQAESQGRAVLGIGRGDSSLAYLGLEPAPVSRFEWYLDQVQILLRGEAPEDGSPIEWLEGQRKVPVDVAATGPRVIGVGARLAERVSFAVGADPERLTKAVATARRAREAADLDPDAVSLGAYVNVVAHPDKRVARDVVRGGLGSFAHFSGMRGAPTDQLAPEDWAVFTKLGRHYDMAHHGRRDASHSALLDDDFVDRFGVVGPADECVDRLGALLDTGIERLVVVGGSRDADPGLMVEANARFGEEVIPALRRRA